jgi:GTPase SAR1 family protein
MPFHVLIEDCAGVDVTNETLSSLQQLVAFGATWDDSCDEMIAKGRARPEAPALRICTLLWTQERADGRPMTYVLIEVVKRGAPNTQAYIAEIQRSREIVLRRKVCVVGAGRSGKTSFVKSIRTQTPQLEEVKARIIEYSTPRRPRLEEVDDRKIGIDLFPLRFEQSIPSRNEKNVHEVTFWDFTGHDAYQVADSLFFSPRTLILVFMDLNAFAIAYMQAAIFADEDFQEPKLLREYVEHAVVRWVRMILRHQPAAEFAFIATKDDAVNGNPVTEILLKDELRSQLKTVGAVVQELTAGKKSTFAIPEMQEGVIFVSCSSLDSVLNARAQLEALISGSDRSAPMPDTYTQALQSIVATRDAAKSDTVTTRIERIFAPVETLPEKLQIESDLCCKILQTLHDLGDVLWYEDLDVGILRQTVILDPMLVIDFIREIFNHKHTALTISHGDLRALPLWRSLPPRNKGLLEAMKNLLQCFKLAYSTAEGHMMSWDSDLIVPAIWQTKIPASWLFLGDFLRVESVSERDGTGESARVRWVYLFEDGLPLSLFDDVVVASVPLFFTFDAGPDWILYRGDEGNTACRIMVDRDRRSLDQSIRVEAVIARVATEDQIDELWGIFQDLVGAFLLVLSNNPELKVSSSAWVNQGRERNLRDLLKRTPPRRSLPWMPPGSTWESFQFPASW